MSNVVRCLLILPWIVGCPGPSEQVIVDGENPPDAVKPLADAIVEAMSAMPLDAPTRLAVYPLPTTESELVPASHWLAAILPVYVAQAQPDWEVFTRQYVAAVMEEQALSNSDFVSADSRLRIGQLVGANVVLTGTLLKQQDPWHVVLALIDAESGQDLASQDVWFTLPAGYADELNTMSNWVSDLPLQRMLSANASAELWEQRGDWLVGQTRFDAAVDAYERAETKGGDTARLSYKIGFVLHTRLGQLDLARTYYDQVTASDLWPGVYNDRAMLHLQLGLLRRAQDDIAVALRLMPDDAGVALNAGTIAFQNQNLPAAQRYYEKAIELANLAAAHDGLAVLFLQEGDLEQALAAVDRALDRDSQALYHAHRGAVLFEMERYEEAADSYRTSTALDENQADVWTDLGRVYRALGQIEASRDAFERALALDPNQSDATDGLMQLRLMGQL